MASSKRLLNLPYVDWPATDRLLWQNTFGRDDPFADTPRSKASQNHCRWSWRRFLGFLAIDEPEALEIAPAQRLTVERIKAFVAHAGETNAPNSVASLVQALYTAARVMMPDRDWSRLKAIRSRLHAAAPSHSPVGPVITSVPLLELGLKLMDECKPEPNTKLNLQKAVIYRDGLMIALLAFAPIRPKNLASLQIGRHLVREGDRWFIVVPREETKTGKRIQFEIPELLVPYLAAYLELIRPAILRGSINTSLWASRKGGGLTYAGIVDSFTRLSKRLGVRFSPHDARDAAVTTWAIARPDQICVSRDLLHHSKLDTTNLYNRARGIEASRAYGQIIREIRKKPTIRDRTRRARFR